MVEFVWGSLRLTDYPGRQAKVKGLLGRHDWLKVVEVETSPGFMFYNEVVGKPTPRFEVGDWKVYSFGTVWFNGGKLRDQHVASLIHDVISRKSESLTSLSGRYVLLFSKGDEVKVVSSVLGTIPIYYTINDRGVFVSTSLQLLSLFSGEVVDINGLRQRCLFYANYGNRTILSNSFLVPHDSIFSVDPLGKSSVCDIGRIKPNTEKSFTSLGQAADTVHEFLRNSISSKLDGIRNASILLSGGRDSRYLAMLLAESIPQNNINLITFGDMSDVEVEIARRFSRCTEFNHEVISPEILTFEDIDRNFDNCEDVNVNLLFNSALIKQIRRNDVPIVESNSPEMFFGHIERGNGPHKTGENFVKNVRSCLRASDVIGGEYIIGMTIEDSSRSFEALNNEIAKGHRVCLYDLISLQRNWCFLNHRIYAQGHSAVNLFDDPALVSLFQRIPKKYLRGYKLYSYLVAKKYPSAFEAITTRDLNLGALLKRSLSQPSVLKYVPKALNAPGPLGSLVERNQAVLYEYIRQNVSKLEGVFSSNYINFIMENGQKNFKHDRISKIGDKVLNRRYLKDYDYLMCCFVISAMKKIG